jgi:CubicO group peptidase (beta-lactamase class C family)
MTNTSAWHIVGWLVLLWIGGCGGQVDYGRRIAFDDGLTTETTEAAPFRAAADYSAQRDGTALVVVRAGRIVFAQGQNGHDLDEAQHLFSGTKSFACALAVLLQMDGSLDLAQPASQVLTGWRADPRKSRITLGQLLDFTSGLDDDTKALTRDGLRLRAKVADKYAHALTLPAVYEPGTHYAYGSQHLMAFGAWVKARLGRDPVAILEERLFGKIGMQFAGWHRDPAGNAALPYGAWTTAREWAKFGVLIAAGGRWQDQQILDPSLLARCFTGSRPMPSYGLTWWLNAEVAPALTAAAELPPRTPGAGSQRMFLADPTETVVVAAGYDDQRLYVFPDRQLVVVRLGHGSVRWRDAEFLAALPR